MDVNIIYSNIGTKIQVVTISAIISKRFEGI